MRADLAGFSQLLVSIKVLWRFYNEPRERSNYVSDVPHISKRELPNVLI